MGKVTDRHAQRPRPIHALQVSEPNKSDQETIANISQSFTVDHQSGTRVGYVAERR
jgi:hypothetical protein